MNAQLDFGYPWWLSYGHLLLTAILVCVLLIGRWRKWRVWSLLPLIVLTLWTAAGFAVMRFVLDLNGRAAMPTDNFFRPGTGRVLDIGAGTGRSSIMVLEARPQATLVASDQFGRSYEQHFGKGLSPQDRLRANLEAAGVANRASVQQADMRKMPFANAEFNAAVSCYAMDHLNREGIDRALSETARVVEPGGEFLLVLIHPDAWLKFAFGPLLLHGHTRGADWWSQQLSRAGFQVLEHGTRPGTLYLVSRRLQ